MGILTHSSRTASSHCCTCPFTHSRASVSHPFSPSFLLYSRHPSVKLTPIIKTTKSFRDTSLRTRKPPPSAPSLHPSFSPSLPPSGRSEPAVRPGHVGPPLRKASSLPSCSVPCAGWTRCYRTSQWPPHPDPCPRPLPRLRRPAAAERAPPESAPPPP